MIEISEIKKILNSKLTSERYAHTLCVAEEAAVLAKRYGADKEKARLAGLLHDICKSDNRDSLLQMMREFGIIPDNVEEYAEKLWHARVGAAFCRQRLGIEDEDVLSAVRYHTTARAGMSLLEKIVFLADYISADRDYEGVQEIRTAVYAGLDSGMRVAAAFSMRELIKKQRLIHPNTVAAYNEAMREWVTVNRLRSGKSI
ncbi:MAG: bis(5'-nucleosyl)-tetraphosphatase (symmetrical) YqeK [Oscillospiraceae bacterium]|jgi:nicotinate-nucleotide adenylyltransferase|nr:bis(5'-nucleosyl)-tetraphosphatase (symmetrical) YqeK [Oscillospiraceae bacterium]